MTPELAEVIDNAVKFAQKVNDPTVPLNCIQTSVFYAWATKKIAELLTWDELMSYCTAIRCANYFATRTVLSQRLVILTRLISDTYPVKTL